MEHDQKWPEDGKHAFLYGFLKNLKHFNCLPLFDDKSKIEALAVFPQTKTKNQKYSNFELFHYKS